MTKFQAGTIHTSQVMDCQVRAIGMAIFTDLDDMTISVFHFQFHSTVSNCPVWEVQLSRHPLYVFYKF